MSCKGKYILKKVPTEMKMHSSFFYVYISLIVALNVLTVIGHGRYFIHVTDYQIYNKFIPKIQNAS